MKNNLTVHFIGIGGIGMSALAKFFLSEGATVSGSDVSSDLTGELERMGAHITIGEYREGNVNLQASMVVYNAGIKENNPELAAARRAGILVKKYAEALGEFTERYFTIAVSGAHGKSTTTGLISSILIQGGLDPTVVIGTKLKEFNESNFRRGHSKYLLIEADEYSGAFLHYQHDIAVVTNIDREHLDFYKDIADIRQAFKKFLLQSKRDGYLILNNDNKDVLDIGMELFREERWKDHMFWYSLTNKKVDELKNILQIPGAHNVSNALAAYKVGEILGIEKSVILKALADFDGAWRRFDFMGEFRGARVYDDYAHHPTEIKATLLGAREHFPTARIWCVFQPHQRERLKYLFDEFTTAFDEASDVVILDPYLVAGREKEEQGAQGETSAELARSLANRLHERVSYVPEAKELREFLGSRVKAGDVIIMMGAGDIWKLTPELV